MIYEQFSVVKVPFPFTDKNTSKRRPAIVISNPNYQTLHDHAVLCMVTSAKNSLWPDDIPLINLEQAGISAGSIIRLKLFTLDVRLILGQLGALGKQEVNQLKANLKKYLAL